MKAVVAPQPDGAEELALVNRPVPRPGKGEVLIEVAAAGVNRPDVLQRRGLYPPPPGAPDILGLEIAGVVVEVGQGAEELRGQRVCALVAGGGYAEYCVAPAGTCLPVPEKLGRMAGLTTTMVRLASFLRTVAGRPVVDKTGLKGSYHVTITYDRAAPPPGSGAAPPAFSAVPSIFTAVHEQLGMKLEPSRAFEELLVIDRLERPSEN